VAFGFGLHLADDVEVGAVFHGLEQGPALWTRIREQHRRWKIVPYIFIGYVQVGVILLAAHFLFHVPMHGSILLLLGVALVFIAANLAMGITFSTIAQNQLQAMQMTFFVFLPSILLSGFMFPFRGMPRWAQHVGEFFPLTHFLRIVRGILLKGNGAMEIWPELWPMALFATVMMTIGITRYRQTLD